MATFKLEFELKTVPLSGDGSEHTPFVMTGYGTIGDLIMSMGRIRFGSPSHFMWYGEMYYVQQHIVTGPNQSVCALAQFNLMLVMTATSMKQVAE